MKKLKYILILILLIHSAGQITAQQTSPISSLPASTLPSEQTMSEIQTMSRPELRDAPPGGGPGLGEIIIPVGKIEYSDLIAVGILYAGFILVRRKNKLKRVNI